MRHVTLVLHAEDGRWWADSPDVPGFTAVANTLNELRALAVEGLEFYLTSSKVTYDEKIKLEGTVDLSTVNRSVPRSDAWHVSREVRAFTPIATMRSNAVKVSSPMEAIHP